MSRIDSNRVQALLRDCESGDRAVKGRALEELAVELFESISGVKEHGVRILDEQRSQEIDVVFTNEGNGLRNLPHLIFVECKNWGEPVGSDALTRFVTKIKSRGESFGILVTKSGITGTKRDGPGSAHFELIVALSHDCAIVVLDEREIRGLKSGERLAELVMKKWRWLKTHRGLYEATDAELSRPEFQRGFREVIREQRRSVVREFLSSTAEPLDSATALDDLRAAAADLDGAVLEAHRVNDDPLWLGPRAALVLVGAAAVGAACVFDSDLERDAEQLERAAKLNGPDRIRAFVGGELWRRLVSYYLEQAGTESELDGRSAALSLVELAIDQVSQIDSIDIRDFMDDL